MADTCASERINLSTQQFSNPEFRKIEPSTELHRLNCIDKLILLGLGNLKQDQFGQNLNSNDVFREI